MSTKIKAGMIIGKWTVVRKGKLKIYESGWKVQHWHCLCKCGNRILVSQGSLKTIVKLDSRSGCMSCRARKHGMSHTPEYNFVLRAKVRARDFNRPFSITWKDVSPLPTHCPLLGIKLRYRDPRGKAKLGGRRNWDSASLDRIVPEKGYIPGNVWVISHRANLMKSQLSLEEIEMLARNLRKKIHGSAYP